MLATPRRRASPEEETLVGPLYADLVPYYWGRYYVLSTLKMACGFESLLRCLGLRLCSGADL